MNITNSHYDDFTNNTFRVRIKRTPIDKDKTPFRSNENIMKAISGFMQTEYGMAIISKYHGVPLIYCADGHPTALIELAKSMIYSVTMMIGRIEVVDESTCDVVIMKNSYPYQTFCKGDTTFEKMNIQFSAIVDPDYMNATFVVAALMDD